VTFSVRDVRDHSPLLSVGLATADHLKLGSELELLARAGVKVAHLDVMDGSFCPATTTAAPALARAISESLAVDVHLMIEDPVGKVEPWIDAGASAVTFQLEGARHAHYVLQSMAGRGVLRGVALAPGSPVALLEPLLDDLELVLVLAVNPGRSKQRFLPSTLLRVNEARRLIGDRDVVVGIDGAVTRENIVDIVRKGRPDVVVSGSAIFDGGDALVNAGVMLDLMHSIASRADSTGAFVKTGEDSS
jgi:ribulose-phosphate 3-epimerase